MKTKDFFNHYQSNFDMFLGIIFLDAYFYYKY